MRTDGKHRIWYRGLMESTERLTANAELFHTQWYLTFYQTGFVGFRITFIDSDMVMSLYRALHVHPSIRAKFTLSSYNLLYAIQTMIPGLNTSSLSDTDFNYRHQVDEHVESRPSSTETGTNPCILGNVGPRVRFANTTSHYRLLCSTGLIDDPHSRIQDNAHNHTGLAYWHHLLYFQSRYRTSRYATHTSPRRTAVPAYNRLRQAGMRPEHQWM